MQLNAPEPSVKKCLEAPKHWIVSTLGEDGPRLKSKVHTPTVDP